MLILIATNYKNNRLWGRAKMMKSKPSFQDFSQESNISETYFRPICLNFYPDRQKIRK